MASRNGGIEASKSHPLQRVAGELVGGELLVLDWNVLLAGIEVAMREVPDFVREDCVQHRLHGIRIVDSPRGTTRN